MKNITAVLMAACFSTGSALALEMTSPDIRQGEPMQQKQVFDGFGCSGENLSPELTWRDVPEGTKSFALMVHDPDAPTGSGWWHWVVFNIPADVRALPRGAGTDGSPLMVDGAVQGRTEFGTAGYGGPCPPIGHGPHRYQFTLFALGVESLPLDASASAAMVGFIVRQNALGSVEIEASYER